MNVADTSGEPVVAEDEAVDADWRVSQLTRVTRAMIGVYKEQFGRGPRTAHTHYAGPDALVCFLEGSFTPAEHNLVRMGEHQRLRETRTLFQYAGEAAFRAAVEEITGRRVVSFLSAVDTAADVSTEIFVFEHPVVA
jgi:uncharacterized protein YbcI